jgi:phage shock protein A
MTLEQLVHSVESRLLEMGRYLLRPDPRSQLREDIDKLAEELRQRHQALARARDEWEATRRRAHDNRTAATLLPPQIQACVRRGQTEDAWRFALELDRVRETLAADQAALPRLEQMCWSLQFLIRQLERRLARLQEQLPAR